MTTNDLEIFCKSTFSESWQTCDQFNKLFMLVIYAINCMNWYGYYKKRVIVQNKWNLLLKMILYNI
jgi:hypothetical protein